jgi:hypothetical protein
MKHFSTFLIITTIVFLQFKLHSQKIETAYDALSKYDYFKAKKLFYEIDKKHPDRAASFGLAIIFHRTDNPFHNLDSAAKYVSLSYLVKVKNSEKNKKVNYFGFFPDSVHAKLMIDSLALLLLKRVDDKKNADGYNKFLEQNYLARFDIISRAVYNRDRLEFDSSSLKNKSFETANFIKTHPQTELLQDAKNLFQRQLYSEITQEKSVAAYQNFIANQPNNIMLNNAYEELYQLYKNNFDTSGLSHFVSDYKNAPQINEAWKLLFSLHVKKFSNTELEVFLNRFPTFPFKNSIEKELQLSNIELLIYEKDSLFGFIDTAGNIVIPPIYDAVTDFHEGLSVVSKNDSTYFINKENTKVFNDVFNEAHVFSNGIASVNKSNKWIFINRQGQTISEPYDEINELSDGIYSVKKDNFYGALDRFGKYFISIKYEKLGDFKNGFAYYVKQNKYGFVSKAGSEYNAQFDWISDVDTNQIFIYKLNNKYGLINTLGKVILQANYDQILKGNSGIYILIQAASYGFFNAEECFMTQVNFEFNKEKDATYYTNGNYFKLIKRGKQSIADLNGKVVFESGLYDDISLKNSLFFKVKKGSKYGYANKKGNIVLPIKYDKASDFNDSLALIKLKNKYCLINLLGKEIFFSETEIEKISKGIFTCENKLINAKGEVIVSDVVNMQFSENFLIITLKDGIIKLLIRRL